VLSFVARRGGHCALAAEPWAGRQLGKPPRVVIAETLDEKLGQSVEFLFGSRLANSEHQRDPLRGQAS
jgi:hypothetical protein